MRYPVVEPRVAVQWRSWRNVYFTVLAELWCWCIEL